MKYRSRTSDFSDVCFLEPSGDISPSPSLSPKKTIQSQIPRLDANTSEKSREPEAAAVAVSTTSLPPKPSTDPSAMEIDHAPATERVNTVKPEAALVKEEAAKPKHVDLDAAPSEQMATELPLNACGAEGVVEAPLLRSDTL